MTGPFGRLGTSMSMIWIGSSLGQVGLLGRGSGFQGTRMTREKGCVRIFLVDEWNIIHIRIFKTYLFAFQKSDSIY
jgi:hypothetical protein